MANKPEEDIEDITEVGKERTINTLDGPDIRLLYLSKRNVLKPTQFSWVVVGPLDPN